MTNLAKKLGTLQRKILINMSMGRQFSEGELAKMTGADNSSVGRALRGLQEQNLVERQEYKVLWSINAAGNVQAFELRSRERS